MQLKNIEGKPPFKVELRSADSEVRDAIDALDVWNIEEINKTKAAYPDLHSFWEESREVQKYNANEQFEAQRDNRVPVLMPDPECPVELEVPLAKCNQSIKAINNDYFRQAFKIIVDAEKLSADDRKELVNLPTDSEFWRSQDLTAMREAVLKFRTDNTF